jgi:hypothetical protein
VDDREQLQRGGRPGSGRRRDERGGGSEARHHGHAAQEPTARAGSVRARHGVARERDAAGFRALGIG